MHSLKELYETWIMILDSLIVPPIDSELDKKIRKIIDRQEKCDHNSTFFRYPYDKSGKENKKIFVTPVDQRDLMRMPCSIGAIVGHEGVENFSRWRGDDKIAWLEIDLNKLVVNLICIFIGGECLRCGPQFNAFVGVYQRKKLLTRKIFVKFSCRPRTDSKKVSFI